jgi:O-antigen/teichoic acid export membrane protein
MKFFHSNAVQSFSLMAMRSFLLIIKFLLTLFITHYLDFESLGFFGLLSAAGVMAPSILGFGIMYNIIRHAVTKDIYEITQDILFYGKFITVLYAVLLIICLTYGIVYNQFLLAMLGIFVVFCEHINGEFYALFLNLSKPFFANLIHFVRSALWAVFYMIGAYIYPEWRHIETLLIFWLVGSVIAAYCYLTQLRLNKETATDNIETLSSYCKKLIDKIKNSSVVYANACVTSLSQYADRYIITAILGLELAGVYIFFWQIYSALSNLLYTGVIQLYRPKLVRAYKEKDPIYNSLFKTCLKKSILLASIFAIITGITLYIFLPHFDKPLIEIYFHLTYWIFIGFIVSIIVEVMSLILYSSHRDAISLKIKIISFLNIIIFNVFFTYFYGLNGAGISFLLSLTIQVILIHFYLKKYHLYHV